MPSTAFSARSSRAALRSSSNSLIFSKIACKKSIKFSQAIKPKQVVQPTPEAARKKAASSGVLAFASDLAQLADDPIVTSIQGKSQLTNQGSQKVAVQRNIISDPDLSRGSGGINTAKFSKDVGSVGLKGRNTTKLSSPVAGLGGGDADGAGGGAAGSKAKRSMSDVHRYLDEQKAKFDRIYRRALRSNPGLQGQIVLTFSILPDGRVNNCQIVSSELKDKDLEDKIIAMFKGFNFGALKVDSVTFNYPMDFFPES